MEVAGVVGGDDGMMENGRCDGCRFWENFGFDQGECRRHSPVVWQRHEAFGQAAIFPKTSKSDWCGDFEMTLLPKEKSDESE